MNSLHPLRRSMPRLGSLLLLFSLLGGQDGECKSQGIKTDGMKAKSETAEGKISEFADDEAARSEATSPLRRPVMLVHGFAGLREFVSPDGYFRGVREQYEQRGIQVYTPELPPFHSVSERGLHLATAIDEALADADAEQLHLIAHSQGGVDARFVLNMWGYAEKIASLTTIATPHRGTPIADTFRKWPRQVLQPFFQALNGAIEITSGKSTGPLDIIASLDSLSTEEMAAFNRKNPDPPSVPVFSIAGVTGDHGDAICRKSAWGVLTRRDTPDYKALPSWLLVRGSIRHPQANDGVVPLESAVWGTFLGCIPADHFDQVGAGASLRPAGSPQRFDHLAFYSAYIDRLGAWEKTRALESMTAPLSL